MGEGIGRFVVYGAGAIGGVLGARLRTSGHEVTLVARGPHLRAIRERGLRLEHPDGVEVVSMPAAAHPGEVAFGPDDVVLLAVKSQDTDAALADLMASAGRDVPVFCAQNGVRNERAALRLFRRVYGVCVMCPAGHLEPGTVRAYSSPTVGILDLGRYPSGRDAVAERVAAAFRASGFVSEVRSDIMRWKYRKLLANLANAIEAACGPGVRGGPLADRAVREAEACLRAAGIAFASREEDLERRGDLLRTGPVGGSEPAGSSWQSLRRGAGTIEADYLNGEIVLLGRLHGIPTPANDMLQDVADEMARRRTPPGTMSMDDLLARLAAAPASGSLVPERHRAGGTTGPGPAAPPM